MKEKILISIILFALPSLLVGQTENSKFYGDVFLNANLDVTKNEVSFRLNRLHFGYRNQFSDALYFNGMIESARENYDTQSSYSGITNLFEFCIGFQHNKLAGKFGLIGTQLNQTQEKLWTHRNVDKIFADKYGFAPTNDFGFVVLYEPIDNLVFDLAITNGEGHKTYQSDQAFRYAAGFMHKTNFGLTSRIYGDILFDNQSNRTNLIAILGYSNLALSTAVELNHQFDTNNIQRSGYSAYLSYKITDKFQFFGRFDQIVSNTTAGQNQAWNIANDGKLAIAGVEYKLHQNISLGIDYRGWIADIDNSTYSYLYFNVTTNF